MTSPSNIVNFPAECDVAIGGKVGLGIPVKDGAGAPVDCSGFALRFQVYDLRRDAIITKQTSVSGEIVVTNGVGTGDKVIPQLVKTDTVNAESVPKITAGKLPYELWRTDVGNEVRLARGFIDFQDSANPTGD